METESNKTSGEKVVGEQVNRQTPVVFLSKLASARTLVPLALIGLSFNLVIFPWRTARLRELSSVADPVLDIRFSYSPEVVFDLASRLGEQGRQFYALSELSVDLVYPLLYSFFFSLLLVLVTRRAFPGRPGWHRVALLPFGVLVCDYAENMSLAIILLGFPGTLPLAPLANLFTMGKWSLGLISIVAILIGSLKLFIEHRVAAPGRAGRLAQAHQDPASPAVSLSASSPVSEGRPIDEQDTQRTERGKTPPTAIAKASVRARGEHGPGR